MESMQPNVFDEVFFKEKDPIYFPEGLPAFETVKDFVIIAHEEEAPFLWLQAQSIPSLAFVTIDPFLIYQDYRPDICDEDVNILNINNEDDAFLLSIVNIHHNPQHGITTNLVSPIVINWKQRLGKQVILQNHLLYTVKHRIDQAEP